MSKSNNISFVQTLYCVGAKNGYIPFVKQTIHLVYALSTAQLFYAVRKHFIKFFLFVCIKEILVRQTKCVRVCDIFLCFLGN